MSKSKAMTAEQTCPQCGTMASSVGYWFVDKTGARLPQGTERFACSCPNGHEKPVRLYET